MAIQSETVAHASLVGGSQISLHSHAGGGSFQFPIGAIYHNISGVNPATELGYGTWNQIAQGQFIVGQNPGDTDFDAAEKTGGEKSHTLTQNEMPAHSHIEQTLGTTTGSIAGLTRDTSMSGSTVQTGVSTAPTGSGQAHNNLPPYCVVFVWKRTA